MEVLVPIVIVTIGIGLLLVFLRRPTVVRPPGDSAAPKANAPMAAQGSDDAMRQILKELKTDMASGGTNQVKIMKGKGEVGWMVTRRIGQNSVSADDLADLEGKAREILAKLAPGSLPSEAPAEADLQYPDSSRVMDSFETTRASDGSAVSRDVYKTTLATDAESAQVLAWYRDWLVGHGWQLSPSTGTSADTSQEYIRASEHLRLAVADPATVAPILAMPIPVGTKTIYEVEYSNVSTQPPTA
jgi:hypothetical protein